MPLKNKKKSDDSSQLHRQHHHEVKIVILGAGGVGKSALTVQYVQGVFIEKYDPTIEDSYRKSVNLQITSRYTDKAETPSPEHHSFRLEILDTAGTEQFTAMRDLYYKSGDAFVLVYSITSTPTLHDLVGMREQLLRIKNAAQVPMVLVGNKIDLANTNSPDNADGASQRVVSVEQGREVAEKWGVPFVETSARRNINIDRVFELLLQEYVHGREEKAFVTKAQSKKNGRKRCAIV